MKFKVSEDMLMWAFRYALGRCTGAITDVVEHLKMHWKKLRPFTQRQIKNEIHTAITMARAGDKCDIERWGEISDLVFYEGGEKA